MKRLLVRALAVAVAVPLLGVVTAGPAAAVYVVTVPGCYGVGDEQFCDVTLYVQWIHPDHPDYGPVCVGWRDAYGARHSSCREEAAICFLLTGWNGTYGPVEIKPGTGGTGGDVYVNGELWWDCQPYEPWPGSES